MKSRIPALLIVIIFLNLNVFSENNSEGWDSGPTLINNTPADSIITNLISEINPDTIEYFMQTLEDWGSRYAYLPNRFEISEWLKDEFTRFGYTDVVLDSFETTIVPPLDSINVQVNVVATLPGSKRPDDIYIIGGHYDSITLQSFFDPFTPAPGADDNASGTALVLEVARVLKKINFQPEATIKFICFASEETGNPEHGSDIYAENALNSGMNIKVMINNDMIAYTTQDIGNSNVNIYGLQEFNEYKLYSSFNTTRYSKLSPNIMPREYGSDGLSFSTLGFPSISFAEPELNPNYHDPTDLVIHCNMDYCAEVTRASSASLISFIGMPSKVENFNVVDIGDGQSLLLNWIPPLDSDYTGYNIYVGTDSATFDTTYSTDATTLIIDDLSEGIEYFVGIRSHDSEGYESFMTLKKGTPNSLPLPPSNIIEFPQWHEVTLDWSPNLEYDLMGYNIYRSADLEELGIKLNTEVITDTVYTDDSPDNGIYYYYTVKAVDSMQNESINNIPVKSRAVSLDQGIFIVDESFDGNGSFLNPTDEEVDEYYNLLLADFVNQDYDILAEGNVSLRDLGAFSTVIWHGSDYKYVTIDQKSIEDIKKFMDFGGNFIYSGFLPCEVFTEQVSYPADFLPGDFIYDYLKINHVENTFGSRFVGALSIAPDYSSVFTDSAKTSANYNYHLPFIEGITAAPQGTEIYSHETFYDTSSGQGNMKNQPVGIEYIGEDFKVITLSFPLYYMNLDESKELINYILIDKFNEVVSIEEVQDYLTPDNYVLMQNFPNPFNPTTKINFTLPGTEMVKIEVYNTIGQKIETILEKQMRAGNHEVEFNAKNLSSGIYFYRIEAGEFQDVQKMILLR